MKPSTRATFDDLSNTPWFNKVGKPYNSDKVLTVSTWNEAIDACSSDYYDWLVNEAANNYTEILKSKNKQKYNQWNKILQPIKNEVNKLLSEKLEDVTKENTLPKTFRDTVEWDIINALMECEYDDVHESSFFLSQLYWYKIGRFPCGWSGKYPDGKLIIY